MSLRISIVSYALARRFLLPFENIGVYSRFKAILYHIALRFSRTLMGIFEFPVISSRPAPNFDTTPLKIFLKITCNSLDRRKDVVYNLASGIQECILIGCPLVVIYF